MSARRFKFRAWDEEKKEMIVDFRIVAEYGEVWKDVIVGEFEIDEVYPVSNVMQSTGLVDKNGKEIFEGDIIRCDHGSQEVRWEYTQSGFHPFIFECFDDNTYEIIGNIYENPELVYAKDK